MRSRARWAWVIVPMALLLLWWGVARVRHFLDTQSQQIASTPTTLPADAASVATLKVPGKGGRLCLQGVEYGPDAKLIYVTARAGTRPTGVIRIEARAPGYVARTQTRPGLRGDTPVILPITPAAREVAGGSLCVRNTGRHAVGFLGVNPGRGSAPVQTTIDGRKVDQQLSLTLLTKSSASLGSRLGSLFTHAAAFKPVTGWEVWVLALLALIGIPIAIAAALISADGDDDRAARDLE